MQEVEIKCINKDPRDDIYDNITHIWWVHNWSKYWITQKEAIRHIKNNDFSFFVDVWWKKVKVMILISQFKNEYIKTEDDWTGKNNLLNLPECDKQIMNIPIRNKFNLFDFS